MLLMALLLDFCPSWERDPSLVALSVVSFILVVSSHSCGGFRSQDVVRMLWFGNMGYTNKIWLIDNWLLVKIPPPSLISNLSRCAPRATLLCSPRISASTLPVKYKLNITRILFLRGSIPPLLVYSNSIFTIKGLTIISSLVRFLSCVITRPLPSQSVNLTEKHD